MYGAAHAHTWYEWIHSSMNDVNSINRMVWNETKRNGTSNIQFTEGDCTGINTNKTTRNSRHQTQKVLYSFVVVVIPV